jgi:hypothetical protein
MFKWLRTGTNLLHLPFYIPNAGVASTNWPDSGGYSTDHLKQNLPYEH